MFHAEPKLRTVIWDFAGEAIPRDMLRAIERLLDAGVPPDVVPLLAPDEQQALLARANAVVRRRRFPKDSTGARYPWPLV